MRKKVLVLGSNFGGLTAALKVKDELHGDVDVTVVAPSEGFLFTPSLIWLPFGKRSAGDITFPVAPTLEHHDVDFLRAAATRIDAEARKVHLATGRVLPYDYLVIATGYRNDEDVVPGFAENAHTITTLRQAERTAAAWQRYLEDPAEVVIAATQGAGCFGAAYEFLFNTAYQLKKAGLRKKVRLTYVTAEPFLGHFGIGGLPHGEQLLGMFLKKEGIDTRLSVAIDHVDDGALVLESGERLTFGFGMVVPPFLGQEFLHATTGSSTPRASSPCGRRTRPRSSTTCTPSGWPRPSAHRGPPRCRSASPRPGSRPSSRRPWPRRTSLRRFAARCPRTRSSSVTSRPCA